VTDTKRNGASPFIGRPSHLGGKILSKLILTLSFGVQTNDNSKNSKKWTTVEGVC